MLDPAGFPSPSGPPPLSAHHDGVAPSVPAAVTGGSGTAASSLSAAASPLGMHAAPSTPPSSSVSSALPAGKTPGAMRKMGAWIKQNPTLFAGIALASVGAIITVACLASGAGAAGAIIGFALIGVGAVLMVKSSEWDASRKPENPKIPLPEEIHNAAEAARRAAAGAPGSSARTLPASFGPAPLPPLSSTAPPPPSSSTAPIPLPLSSTASSSSSATSFPSPRLTKEQRLKPLPPIPTRASVASLDDDPAFLETLDLINAEDASQSQTPPSGPPPPLPYREITRPLIGGGSADGSDNRASVLTQEEVRADVDDSRAKRTSGNMVRSGILRLVNWMRG